MNLYWERQVGDNCRIHSLNAMFGFNKISENLFKEYCKEYDSMICGLDSIEMDGFAECRSIINYIVDKINRKYTQLIPINLNNIHMENRLFWKYDRFICKLGDDINEYFEFNKQHVWFNKCINGLWYKIDSLSGVTQQSSLKRFSDHGYILVFEKKAVLNEIEYLISILKTHINEQNKKDNCNNFRHKNHNLIENHNIEISFYNLYYMLTKIKLNYTNKYDSDYNSKITVLRLVLKNLHLFITENRKKNLNIIKINKLKQEILNIIFLF